ncbi:hypothetical protein Tco_1264489 [Tanacetum coccineum]
MNRRAEGHANHRVAYEALQDSIRRDEIKDFDVDKAQEETKKKNKQDSLNTPAWTPPTPPPPPPPPSVHQGLLAQQESSDSCSKLLPPSSSNSYMDISQQAPAAPSSFSHKRQLFR